MKYLIFLVGMTLFLLTQCGCATAQPHLETTVQFHDNSPSDLYVCGYRGDYERWSHTLTCVSYEAFIQALNPQDYQEKKL